MDGCTPNRTQLTRYSEAGLIKAGCIQHISRYKPPSSLYCYCDYNLCNGVINNGANGISSHSLWALISMLMMGYLVRLDSRWLD